MEPQRDGVVQDFSQKESKEIARKGFLFFFAALTTAKMRTAKGDIMKRLNEMYIRYSVDELTKLEEQIRTLQHKLNPSNFDQADTHLSIEEKYEYRIMFNGILAQLHMLQTETNNPTGEDQPTRRFFRK